MLKKKILLFLMLFLLVFTTACVQKNDYGIIRNLYVKDTVIQWSDVKGATYYEIFAVDAENPNQLSLVDYTFASEFRGNDWLEENAETSFKIKVSFEDKEPEFSDVITVNFETEFPMPGQIFWSDEWNTLYWQPAAKTSGFLNYTLMINGNEIFLEDNVYDFSTYVDELLVVQVRSNYEDGFSRYTEPRYRYNSLEFENIDIEYDPDSDEDLVIDFVDTESIIVILDLTSRVYGFCESGNNIYDIKDSYISVNDDYVDKRTKYIDTRIMFTVIITEDTYYVVYISPME
ncbi:hypothetical protein RJI07_03815 [Mycoplasmatota bacterium WC30]